MKLPNECIATTKTGKKEARVLVQYGKYVMYEYRELGGKKVNKYSILLKRDDGKIEHLMIVPLKNRELVVKHAVEESETRGVWDEKNEKVLTFP